MSSLRRSPTHSLRLRAALALSAALLAACASSPPELGLPMVQAPTAPSPLESAPLLARADGEPLGDQLAEPLPSATPTAP